VISEVRARFLNALCTCVPIVFVAHALRVIGKTLYGVSLKSLPFGGRERPAVRAGGYRSNTSVLGREK
jgi:hypothetical protein